MRSAEPPLIRALKRFNSNRSQLDPLSEADSSCADEARGTATSLESDAAGGGGNPECLSELAEYGPIHHLYPRRVHGDTGRIARRTSVGLTLSQFLQTVVVLPPCAAIRDRTIAEIRGRAADD